VAEVAVKKSTFVRRWWRVSPTVSRLLTVGFVVVTSGWFFFPLIRSGIIERLASEALMCIDFVKHKFLLLLLGD